MFAPPFSILVLSSTPTTSSRTLPLRSSWNVIVRCPTALITPSTSTALVLAAFAGSVFSGAGAGAGAGLGAGATAGAGAGLSSTDEQATTPKVKRHAPMDPITKLHSLVIQHPPYAANRIVFVRRTRFSCTN